VAVSTLTSTSFEIDAVMELRTSPAEDVKLSKSAVAVWLLIVASWFIEAVWVTGAASELITVSIEETVLFASIVAVWMLRSALRVIDDMMKLTVSSAEETSLPASVGTVLILVVVSEIPGTVSSTEATLPVTTVVVSMPESALCTIDVVMKLKVLATDDTKLPVSAVAVPMELTSCTNEGGIELTTLSTEETGLPTLIVPVGMLASVLCMISDVIGTKAPPVKEERLPASAVASSIVVVASGSSTEATPSTTNVVV